MCAHRIFGFSLQFVALSEVRGDGSQGEEGQQALCADYNHLQSSVPLSALNSQNNFFIVAERLRAIRVHRVRRCSFAIRSNLFSNWLERERSGEQIVITNTVIIPHVLLLLFPFARLCVLILLEGIFWA